jgi:hypothetical protein
MYGVTRGAVTLIGVAVAGFLLWLTSTITNLGGDGDITVGQFWAVVGLWAAAGLVMALSQLLGGWTKWGWPRISMNVLLLAFLPALIGGGWVLAAGEPGTAWLGEHIRNWSSDIGVDGVVDDLLFSSPALAFGIGLVFGFTFDTTGPRIRTSGAPAAAVADQRQTTNGSDGAGDERRVRIREGGAPSQPEPEPAPRTGEPPKE